MIITETDRLIIRESSGRDFSRIYCMMQSAGENETTDRISDNENEELEKFLAYIHTVYSVFGFGLWTVCLKPETPIHPEGTLISGGLTESIRESCLETEPESGTQEEIIIGRCGLQPAADENSPLGRIELGYLIDREYRGMGYAYEACSAILSYAFEKLGIEEVSVRIDPGNEASAALAGKLGFGREKEDLWILRNPLL